MRRKDEFRQPLLTSFWNIFAFNTFFNSGDFSISENSEVHKSATPQQNGPSSHSSAWLWAWKWYEHEAEHVHFSKPRRGRRENVFISSKAAFCWKLAFLCLFAWEKRWCCERIMLKSQLWWRCNISIMAKAIQHVIAPLLNYWLWNSKIHWQYQFSNCMINFENDKFEQIRILTTSIDIREAFWFQIEHLTKRLRCGDSAKQRWKNL